MRKITIFHQIGAVHIIRIHPLEYESNFVEPTQTLSGDDYFKVEHAKLNVTNIRCP